jgi:Na+-translocating ferredoxin:NAD+ oxidoreductase subunit G
MSIWAICSRPRLRLSWVCLLGGFPATLQAQLSLDEALRVAFPAPTRLERRTAFLSAQDLEAARKQAGLDAPVTQRVVTYYVAQENDSVIGVAYFDSHRVRTLNEVVMIVVVPPDRIRSVEVLRFAEPPEYHATEPWLKQFENRSLSPELSLKASIRNLSGATLTSNAIVRATRRVLALHARIHPFSVGRATGP